MFRTSWDWAEPSSAQLEQDFVKIRLKYYIIKFEFQVDVQLWGFYLKKLIEDNVGYWNFWFIFWDEISSLTLKSDDELES